MNANIKPKTPVSRNDGLGVVPALTFGKDGNMDLTEDWRGIAQQKLEI